MSMAYYTSSGKRYFTSAGLGEMSRLGDTVYTWFKVVSSSPANACEDPNNPKTHKHSLYRSAYGNWTKVKEIKNIGGVTWFGFLAVSGKETWWVPSTSASITTMTSTGTNAPDNPPPPPPDIPEEVTLVSPTDGVTIKSPVLLSVVSKNATDFNFQILDTTGTVKTSKTAKISKMLWTLSPDTYGWKVIASNGKGTAESPTWSFTIEQPAAPPAPPTPKEPITTSGNIGTGTPKQGNSVLPWVLGGVGAFIVGGTVFVIIKKRRTMTPKQAATQLATQQSQMYSSPNKLSTLPTFPPRAKRIF
jgi:hypothetical protein